MRLPSPIVFYVAICTDCRPVHQMTFRTLGEREGWCDDHTFQHPDHEVLRRTATVKAEASR